MFISRNAESTSTLVAKVRLEGKECQCRRKVFICSGFTAQDYSHSFEVIHLLHMNISIALFYVLNPMSLLIAIIAEYLSICFLFNAKGKAESFSYE